MAGPEVVVHPEPGGFSKKAVRKAVHERDGFTCQYCGKLCFHDATVDHVIAKTHGGPYTLENLRTACQACNFLKGTRTVEELRFDLMLRRSKYAGIIQVDQYLKLRYLGELEELPRYEFHFERSK